MVLVDPHEGLEEAQKDLVGAPGGHERAPGGPSRLQTEPEDLYGEQEGLCEDLTAHTAQNSKIRPISSSHKS